MSVIAPIILGVLVALSLGCVSYYGAMLHRVRRVKHSLPTLRAGIAMPGPADGRWPSVCVIVPAHNEQAIIGTLVRSLLKQDYPGGLHFVFALDRCTDNTQAVVLEAAQGDPRVEIVTVTSCPEDWAGKVNAIWRGVNDAVGLPSPRTADLVLFTDADTEFDPACIRAGVNMLQSRGLDMLSLLPTLTCEKSFEKIAQPAAGLEMVRRFPLDRVNREHHGARFANGQFMLFRRESYERLGGHEVVHDELLEDLAFARKIRHKEVSMRLGVLLADGLLKCRMYADYAAFRRGWKRIYVESEHRHAPPLRRWSRRLMFVGVVLPISVGLMALAGLALAVGLWSWHGTPLDNVLGILALILAKVGLSAFLGAMREVYSSQKVPIKYLALYPIGAWQVASILLEGARDLRRGKATEWGGRSYTRARKNKSLHREAASV